MVFRSFFRFRGIFWKFLGFEGILVFFRFKGGILGQFLGFGVILVIFRF